MYGKLGVLVRSVLQTYAESVLAVDPFPVFVDIAGVDYHQIFGSRILVDDQVVHNTALAVRHAGVLRLACIELANVVGGDVLQEVQCAFAFYPELTHVAHVKHAHACADDHVLLVNACRVLDRHIEAGKLCHFCTECNVHVGKRCCF